MNFEITEDVQDLLKILRETGFDWIASEIQNLIKEGKAIDKLISEPNSRSLRKPQIETATVPFPGGGRKGAVLQHILCASDANKTSEKRSMTDQEFQWHAMRLEGLRSRDCARCWR
jgi:hypothetical protein